MHDEHDIFVYGTLMNGFGNHALLRGAEFIKSGRTPPSYTMYSLGGFPGVCEGGETAVVGEIYRVKNTEMLRRLDSLEGHPNWYRRTPITLEDGSEVEMYVYLNGDPNMTVVESGSWRQFRL